jgi:hypothetical protein
VQIQDQLADDVPAVSGIQRATGGGAGLDIGGDAGRVGSRRAPGDQGARGALALIRGGGGEQDEVCSILFYFYFFTCLSSACIARFGGGRRTHTVVIPPVHQRAVGSVKRGAEHGAQAVVRGGRKGDGWRWRRRRRLFVERVGGQALPDGKGGDYASGGVGGCQDLQGRLADAAGAESRGPGDTCGRGHASPQCAFQHVVGECRGPDVGDGRRIGGGGVRDGEGHSILLLGMD